MKTRRIVSLQDMAETVGNLGIREGVEEGGVTILNEPERKYFPNLPSEDDFSSNFS